MVVQGKKLTQKEHWQKLKSELKDMTPKQKLEHLWEYYKWVLGVVGAFILIVATVIASIISLNTETILSGAIVNVPVNMEGYVMLQEGFYNHAKTEGRQMVGITSFTLQNPYTTVEHTYTWDVIDSVTAMVGSDSLDYLMYDELAAIFFMTPDYFTDLRELFSEEELEAMGNAVIELQNEETGEYFPIAIDIRDTEFYDFYMLEDKTIYLSFSSRLPRKEACKDFWQYLKGGKTTVLQTMLAGFVIDAPLAEDSVKTLKTDFFKDQGYTLGDHRVEFATQSFLPAVDEQGVDQTPAIRKKVLAMLEDGTMDHVLCGADSFAQLNKEKLLDLSQIMTEEQLRELDGVLILENGVAVAVDISGLPRFVGETEGPVYLAFSAETKRLQACKDLWNMIYTKE